MKKIILILLGLSTLASAGFSRNDAIVTDNSTALQWQDDKVGDAMKWEEAISYCEDLNLSSHEDWRLPNYNELNSIVDRTKSEPATDSIFKNINFSYYWSSTTVMYSDYNYNSFSWAFTIDFEGGYTGWGYRNDKNNDKVVSLYVRCVRGGQDNF